jgi:hypothetical protein
MIQVFVLTPEIGLRETRILADVKQRWGRQDIESPVQKRNALYRANSRER